MGRVGSLISQGVYSVATPFHPFGGAVDIIAVEQEDGTYRSTPWYVCFGKFQGVLKGAEKVVTISVNGVEANFHMYLDNSGKAYFMREVAPGGEESESNNHTLERCQSDNTGGNTADRLDIYNEDREEGEGDEQSFPDGSAGFNPYHYGNLNEVEGLVKSPDNLSSDMVLISVDGHILTAPISSNEENTDSVQLSTPQFHLGPGESSGEEFGPGGAVWDVGYFGDMEASMPKDTDGTRHQPKDVNDGGDVAVHVQESRDTVNIEVPESSENTSACLSKDDMFKSCLDLSAHVDDAGSVEADSLSREHNPRCSSDRSSEHCPFSEVAVVEIGEADPKLGEDDPVSIGVIGSEKSCSSDFTCKDDQVAVDVSLHNFDLRSGESSPSKNIKVETTEENAFTSPVNVLNTNSAGGSDQSVINDAERTGNVTQRVATDEESSHTEISTLQRSISGLGFEISLCGNLLSPGMGRSSAEEAFDDHRISEEEFRKSGPSIIKDANLIIRLEERYFLWDKVAHIIVGKAVFGSHFSVEPKDSIPVEHKETTNTRDDAGPISPTYSRRWRLWSMPFRRAKSLQHSDSNSSNEELFVDSESGLQNANAEQISNANSNQSPRKQFLQTNIPTTEQIASLNLKEGQNKIAFSFSTRVLGKQEVDAHVYLWKWNARIVISDVDGTITKSDVLGQFMPLVGKDWTQSGVARLFSAIKENGYQLLFLSARAIVQAYLTRSFLLNLKQDGKALPSGPVVISPDGLFPSLYREVIRRAPHEFKIACLEDIRALFPSDYNPFYAGFGNRDTDELSYRKIGIPKGKIFIINPKGEVAINHCIDVKSYTSLHTLVNDMFPPTSLVEQEDFNSWNYWRTPLPIIDC